MTRREPNVIDKILGLLPGYESFSRKESRRGADKRLRDHVAERLERSKRHVDDVVLELTNAGNLGALDPAGRLQTRLGACAEAIRHAEYGESGFTDDRVVSEEDLQRLYEHDLSLLEQARTLGDEVESLHADGFEDSVGAVLDSADEMRRAIDQRDELLREVF